MANDARTLRILFVSANPWCDIDTEAELKRIREIIDRIPGVEFHPLVAATIDDIQNELLARDFDIFHLASHGVSDEVLLESAGDGFGCHVPAHELIALLRLHGSLRCVVLNACRSAEWIHAPFGPALIAMRNPVGDSSSREFSDAFYRSVVAGRDYDFAYEQGRTRALRKERPDTEHPFSAEFWPNCFGEIGVRSHARFDKDQRHRRCQFFANLERFFPAEGEGAPDWMGLAAALRCFVDEPQLRASMGLREHRLHLECNHGTAFLLGRLLGSDAKIHPMQGRHDPQLWRPELSRPLPRREPWKIEAKSVVAGGKRLAVSLSVTSDATTLVQDHLRHWAEPTNWYDFTPRGGGHAHAIKDGDHCYDLARSLIAKLAELRVKSGCDAIDLFTYAPNALLFMLGQYGGAALGTIHFYAKLYHEDVYVPTFTSKASCELPLTAPAKT